MIATRGIVDIYQAKAQWSAFVSGFLPFFILIRLLIVGLFCQLWFTVGSFTVRFEDLVVVALLAIFIFPVLLTGKLHYRRNILSIPLILWVIILVIGIGVTLWSPLDSTTKKDALVNGVRLILAFSLFFLVYYYPAPAKQKIDVVVSTTVAFSLVTTAVALLQMGHWDGWLSISLPDALITFKEGANTEKGRELFSLYLGDTDSHTWSAALAMQALMVWLLGYHTKNLWHKAGAWLYFGILCFILIRISVRSSILGLFITIVGLELLGTKRTRDLLLLFLRPVAVITVIGIALVLLFYFAPDSYFIERIRVAVPTFENGNIIVSRASNIYGRFRFWETAFKIFSASPIWGGGFYSYSALSEVYGGRSVIHAHNSYIQTLSDLGIVGAAALSLLIMGIFSYLRRIRRYTFPHAFDTFWWRMIAGSFIFMSFAALFGNPFWSPNYIAFRMVLLGTLANLVREGVR